MPVARPPVGGKGENGIGTVANEVAEDTLPLFATAAVDPKPTLPLPPLPPMLGAPVDPPTVIRTGGLR